MSVIRNDTDMTADVKGTIGTVEMRRKCETYLFELEDMTRSSSEATRAC